MLHALLPKLRRILCLGAHADDIEIGCGGTLLRLIREQPKVEVDWVVFSSNAIRRAEAEASARRFLDGADEVMIHMLDLPDGYFPTVGKDLKDRFFAIRQRFQPDLILTHRLEDRHQDHRIVAELTWQTFREHLIWEYEIPKYEGDLGQPNLFVDLSQELCGLKIDLLMKGFPSQATKPWFDPQTFSALMRLRGVEAGPPTRFAEAFTARKVVV